jgi:hypothetical protein
MHKRAVLVGLAAAALAGGFSPGARALTVGSANTATADPLVLRPRTTPCTVQLFVDDDFADFSPKLFAYAPPAGCNPPWAKVVLEADFSVDAGRQFDRTANVWIAGVNVYFGTTAEPSGTVSRSWHVERDPTDYSALLSSAQTGEVDLGNLVNSTFTSHLHGSAAIQFYPLTGDSEHSPRAPDLVLPLGRSDLATSSRQLAQTFTLPRNIERAYLDVIAQSQANDEFWYTCAPDDVAAELVNCGATSFRESEVTIDGQPAGVAPIYPWIYTGGIDPLLWRPIPDVQTLNFVPYRVDLTPFAALLDDGQPHTIAVSVFNADHHFTTTAALLAFLDAGSAQLSGALTDNTLGPPGDAVAENLNVAPANSSVRGTVGVTSERDFLVAGFVNTSHGKVRTEVSQHIAFSNQQTYDVEPAFDGSATYVENVAQRTTISSLTVRKGGGPPARLVQQFEWPLVLGFAFTSNADGSFQQTTSVDQAFELTQSGRSEDTASFVSNHVTSADTLQFDANGNLTGFANRSSSQRYFARDASGCYSRQITSANGSLTSITDGMGCGDR